MTGQLLEGTVHETGGGVYAVALRDGTRITASIRGRLKREARVGGRVVIGDHVEVSESDGAWTIEAVHERATQLVRRGHGRAAKILAANLDHVFVIVALRDPNPSTQLIDRLLVLVESSGMRPVLVLNKADLDGALEIAEVYEALYSSVGYAVIVTSAESGRGVETLHGEMCDGSSAFIGPSGVGKSTLLNAIDPALTLKTGELSKKTGTGRHTTVGSRMIVLACGGLVADTPGFGDVGLWSVPPEDIAGCFPEFDDFAVECRFRGCAHMKEPECEVRNAVADGRLPESRYASYLLLRAEAEAAEGH